MHLHKIEKKAYHQRGGACLQGKGWYSIAILQYCSLQLKLPLLAIKKLGLPIFSGVGPLCWLQTQLAGREKLGSRATLNSAALRCWWAAAALCGKVGRRPRHRSGPTDPLLLLLHHIPQLPPRASNSPHQFPFRSNFPIFPGKEFFSTGIPILAKGLISHRWPLDTCNVTVRQN